MDNKLANIKQFYMDKFGITQWQIENQLVFLKLDDGEYLVAMEFLESNDNIFYLFAPTTNDNFDTLPIAQIKFQQQDNSTIFIRRLEFIDETFKGKGYASKFINMFENFCLKQGNNHIVGEFDPLHGESEEKVKKFYLRNGYDIKTIENKPWISKFLRQNINNNELEF